MKKITHLLLAVFALTAISATSQTTQKFEFTGKVQTFVVPKGVTSITVDMAGGSGGNVTTAIGGKGGRVQCTVPVTPGETLQIYVGGKGFDGDNTTGRIMGGFNG